MAAWNPVDHSPVTARDYPHEWIQKHIEQGRRRNSLLGEIREVIFGAQDGLVSTLAVVATVAGASTSRFGVLVAGIASAVAGIFSMSIGEYMSSKSQAEIAHSKIAEEWQEVTARPLESEAEVLYMFMEEGMTEDDAAAAAEIIARHPRSLLTTMVSKELGLIVDEDDETSGSPLRGAFFMGGSFAAGSLVPLAPYFLGSGTSALVTATVATCLTLFTIGAIKSRWTHRHWLISGLEVLALAAFAGVAGYGFGTLLPDLLGYAA
jgi:VIT1/CCC1 family predicted Fe2+/Mn2+ transporter